MDFNIVTNNEVCIANTQYYLTELVYYAHFLMLGLSLLFGLFVFLRNKTLLASKCLLGITLFFSLWLIFDFILWKSADSALLMFSWAILSIFETLFFLLGLYFVYTFIDKKDVSRKIKLIFLIASLPVFLLVPTKFNLSSFDAINCVPIGSGGLLQYVVFLESIILFWIFILLVVRYRKPPVDISKSQIFLLGLGIMLFFSSYFILSYVSDYLYNLGYEWGYQVEQGGILAMGIFLGFLSYLIVKFKAFDIRLIGAQVLVLVQFSLISSMFFFATVLMSRIIIGITLLGTTVAGWYLIQSIKSEIRQKEELEKISHTLMVANERLKELDTVKSEFISIASHQLRTPLTALKGYLSLLLEGSYGPVSAQVLDVLNKLYGVNNRLVRLVEDLLNVSRIESGRIQYSFAPTQIEPIISELIEMFQSPAKEKNLTLDLHLPANPLPLITVDPNKIKEVVSNLIDNSVKYTTTGGVTVTVESTPLVARIVVSDTGIGIKESDMKNLFQKFLRSKETSRMVVSGAGLGLYVGKSFIEAHGGKIWAESDGPNKGSRFIIELPIKNTKVSVGTFEEPALEAKEKAEE